jgi:hypothetical protein
MLLALIMKKQAKKSLMLARDVVRTLEVVYLVQAIGGAGGSVGGDKDHPLLTCGCPNPD